MTPAPPPAPTSLILDLIGQLPPWAQLLAYGLPILVFVTWGPWAWVAGLGLAVWLGPIGGIDIGLVAVFVGGAAGYVLSCRWDPMLDCWWCNGSPKRRNRNKKKRFHFCFVCGGTGRRYALGARVWPRYRDK